jgi:hypothetical protein
MTGYFPITILLLISTIINELLIVMFYHSYAYIKIVDAN